MDERLYAIGTRETMYGCTATSIISGLTLAEAKAVKRHWDREMNLRRLYRKGIEAPVTYTVQVWRQWTCDYGEYETYIYQTGSGSIWIDVSKSFWIA